jgi:hypothetical protein
MFLTIYEGATQLHSLQEDAAWIHFLSPWKRRSVNSEGSSLWIAASSFLCRSSILLCYHYIIIIRRSWKLAKYLSWNCFWKFFICRLPCSPCFDRSWTQCWSFYNILLLNYKETFLYYTWGVNLISSEKFWLLISHLIIENNLHRLKNCAWYVYVVCYRYTTIWNETVIVTARRNVSNITWPRRVRITWSEIKLIYLM